MNERQKLFVLEYCKDLNATQAAIRSGYSKKTAGQIGERLLKNVEISEAVSAKVAKLTTKAEITVEAVLQRWWDIANADPNELVVNAIDCCRYCHGAMHGYQWTEAEYSREVDKAVDSGKPSPDGLGGFGFDPHRPPHPECPECFGNGVERVSVADTRKLKGSARRLYAGIQKTKDGVKVLMRDQDAALANIARYLGMTKERVDLVTVQAKSLDDFYGAATKSDVT